MAQLPLSSCGPPSPTHRHEHHYDAVAASSDIASPSPSTMFIAVPLCAARDGLLVTPAAAVAPVHAICGVPSRLPPGDGDDAMPPPLLRSASELPPPSGTALPYYWGVGDAAAEDSVEASARRKLLEVDDVPLRPMATAFLPIAPGATGSPDDAVGGGPQRPSKGTVGTGNEATASPPGYPHSWDSSNHWGADGGGNTTVCGGGWNGPAEDTTLDADAVAAFVFEPMDHDEEEAHERMERARRRELRMRAIELEEWRTTYSRVSKRSFRSMRRFPEPLHTSTSWWTEEDGDRELELKGGRGADADDDRDEGPVVDAPVADVCDASSEIGTRTTGPLIAPSPPAGPGGSVTQPAAARRRPLRADTDSSPTGPPHRVRSRFVSRLRGRRGNRQSQSAATFSTGAASMEEDADEEEEP